MPPGTRVRMSVPIAVDGVSIKRTERPMHATVVGIDTASITARMESDGALRTFPLSAVTRLDVSRGTLSADEGRRKGMRRGALVGAGAVTTGVVLYYLFDVVAYRVLDAGCNGPPEPDTCAKRFNSHLPYLAAGIGVGALGGGWVGMRAGARERESWERVSPGSLRPVGMPRDVSFTVSLKL